MSKKASIPGTAEAWESGQLGRSDAHARKTSKEIEDHIDEALGLQAISIRLPKSTIKAYKQLAEMHGVGYQPLMRDAICRWADTELKSLLTGAIQSQRAMLKSKADKAGADDHKPTARELKKAA